MAAGDIHHNLKFDDVTFAYNSNFSGADPNGYNTKHERYFDILLDEHLAQDLADEGWAVRTYIPKRDNADPIYSLRCFIRYDVMPPKIWQITSSSRFLHTEETISGLDRTAIKHVELLVRPYNYDFRGRIGTKAMVENMYVTIDEDPVLDDPYYEKYKDLPVTSAPHSVIDAG